MTEPSPKRDWRTTVFVAGGRLSARLPAFRGKVRTLQALYGLLGLRGRHVVVDARLARPVAFGARLDLFSPMERMAFLAGEYEAETVEFLVGLYEQTGGRGCLLDVGANIGLLAIPAAIRMREAGAMAEGPLVVAVEAVGANATVLRSNCSRNGVDRQVRVLELALGDAVRTVDVHVDGNLGEGEGTGTANVIAEASRHDCVRIPVQLATLDGCVADGRVPLDCAVVKIDTDGYDLKVLQGGTEFLRRARPVIFGEFSAHCMRWHGQSLEDVLRFAESLDYAVWRRRPAASWRFSDDPGGEPFAQDLLLVPRERAAGLTAWLADSARAPARRLGGSAIAPQR